VLVDPLTQWLEKMRWDSFIRCVIKGFPGPH
jgi:hypothetical protein